MVFLCIKKNLWLNLLELVGSFDFVGNLYVFVGIVSRKVGGSQVVFSFGMCLVRGYVDDYQLYVFLVVEFVDVEFVGQFGLVYGRVGLLFVVDVEGNVIQLQ